MRLRVWIGRTPPLQTPSRPPAHLTHLPLPTFPTPPQPSLGGSLPGDPAKLTAGRWPQFTERQFATRAHMTKTRPLAPTFDREVLNHIQSGLDLALEAELGYDYAFPALRLP